MRCSGAVLLRVGRNGGRYCTCKSTLLPAGPAWSTAPGARAADQRGLAVRRRDWPADCRRSSLRPKVSLFPERSVRGKYAATNHHVLACQDVARAMRQTPLAQR
eukprot:COSAG06_NODE_4173_length_4500_cov_10.549875_1_plen_104_part_00